MLMNPLRASIPTLHALQTTDVTVKIIEAKTALIRRHESRNGMRRIGIPTIIFALLMTFGCSSAIRTSRSQETEALLRAASAGNADTVRSLLASPNVDVNGVDDQGNTALILAARFGHNEVVRALLLAKADVKVRNKDGKTALMLAAEGGHDQTVAALTLGGT
jgi:hypothetical protein